MFLTTTLIVITPVSVHRHLSGQHTKERVVATGQRALMVAVTGVALLISGILTFIFDVVVGRLPALCVGAGAAVVAVTLLLVIPWRLSQD